MIFFEIRCLFEIYNFGLVLYRDKLDKIPSLGLEMDKSNQNFSFHKKILTRCYFRIHEELDGEIEDKVDIEIEICLS